MVSTKSRSVIHIPSNYLIPIQNQKVTIIQQLQLDKLITQLKLEGFSDHLILFVLEFYQLDKPLQCVGLTSY